MKNFKKLTSIFLCILMLAALAVPFGGFSASAASEPAPVILPDENWSTSGTELEISNASELLAFATSIANGNAFEGKTIKITEDIDVNPGYTGGVETPTNIWPDTYNKAFKGVIDGQGHTLSGLYKRTEKAGFGFFGDVNSSYTGLVEVKNLAIVNSAILLNHNTTENCGTLFASVWNADTKISNVYIDCNFYGTNGVVTKDGGRVGGFVGMYRAVQLTFENCVFAGEMKLRNNANGASSWNWCGGFIGQNNNSADQNKVKCTAKICATAKAAKEADPNLDMETFTCGGCATATFNSCAFYGKLYAEGGSGAFVGRIGANNASSYVYNNCIAAGYVSQRNTPSTFGDVRGAINASFTNVYNTGGGNNMPTFNAQSGGTVVGAPVSINNEKLATLTTDDTAFASWQYVGDSNAPIPAQLATYFADDIRIIQPHTAKFTNTADTEYEISTVAELLGFAQKMGDLNADNQTFVLTNDIVINDDLTRGTAKNINWFDLHGDNFKGTFDGQGHYIYGIYYIGNYQTNHGIFANPTGNATVKNVSLVNTYMVANNGCYGGLFGNIGGSGTVTVDNVYLDVEIENRYEMVKAETDEFAFGGVIGRVTGTGTVNVSNVVVAADVNAPLRMGVAGVVGMAEGAADINITDTAVYSTVTGSGNSTGAIIGRATAPDITLTRVVAAGKLVCTGSPKANGALVGSDNSSQGTLSVTDCFVTGDYSKAFGGYIPEGTHDVTELTAVNTVPEELAEKWASVTYVNRIMPKTLAENAQIEKISHICKYVKTDESVITENTHVAYCVDCPFDAPAKTEAHYGGTATCKEKASCEVCGTVYGTVSNHEGTEATCIKKSVCDACGEEFGDFAAHNFDTKNWSHDATHCFNACKTEGCTQRINNAEHDFGDWIVTKEATATEDGSRRRSCSECGYEAVETIAKTGADEPEETTAETTEDTVAETETETEAEEEKSGCGSSIAGSVILVAPLALGACVIRKKVRKED